MLPGAVANQFVTGGFAGPFCLWCRSRSDPFLLQHRSRGGRERSFGSKAKVPFPLTRSRPSFARLIAERAKQTASAMKHLGYSSQLGVQRATVLGEYFAFELGFHSHTCHALLQPLRVSDACDCFVVRLADGVAVGTFGNGPRADRDLPPDLPPFSGPLVSRVCSPFVCHHSAA